MGRGNGGQRIFLHHEDWSFFLRTLAATKQALPFELFAYCLMPNHFHLLLRICQASLSRIMQRLESTYAQYINRREARDGHLFQGRFKSFTCPDDTKVLKVLRYIHLNPVRAGLAASPGLWPWSGHGEYLGSDGRNLISWGFPLSLFSTNVRLAQEAYLRFIGEDMNPAASSPESVKSAPSGTRAPVQPVIQSDIETLADTCAQEGGISVFELRGRTRRRAVTTVRATFIRRALGAGWSAAELGRFLKIGHPAVRKAALSRSFARPMVSVR